MDVLVGTLMKVRYDSGEGFVICDIMTDAGITAVKGKMLNPQMGLDYRMEGDWVMDPKWGQQFTINRAERMIPKTEPGIRNYLAKVAPGVGPKIADAIVRNFGIDTLDVLKENPNMVAEMVSGITYEGAVDIQMYLVENDNNEAVMIELVDMFHEIPGIFKSLPEKCIKLWRHDAAEVVKTNPYKLTQISGVGFPMADSVAIKLGIPFDSEIRKQAAIIYSIKTLMNDGHIWINKMFLDLELQNYIGPDHDDAMGSLMQSGVIECEVLNNDPLSQMFYAFGQVCMFEKENAMMIMNLRDGGPGPVVPSGNIFSYGLEERQIEAVQIALYEPVCVIYGYAGTGKTFTLKAILDQFKQALQTVAIACPTGKAAKRAMESTGHITSTIHRLLECVPDMNGGFDFAHNEENPLPHDVIVLDETSMVDNSLMNSLLKAIAPHRTRLILVGDPGQLPSVGPGQIFGDIINSNIVPGVKLQKIHRNSGVLVECANTARKGMIFEEPTVFNPEVPEKLNYMHVETDSMEETLDQIIHHYCGFFPTQFECDPVKDVQILSPQKKTIVGTKHLNQVIQMSINPNYKTTTEPQLFMGDKVMNTKNGKIQDFYIVNGDSGTVDEIGVNWVSVWFEDYNLSLVFKKAERRQLELCYAMTIHKSQGSEYRFVIIPVDPAFTFFADRRLFYTALTRASVGVITIGQFSAIRSIVKNDRRIDRNTRLISRLKDNDL